MKNANKTEVTVEEATEQTEQSSVRESDTPKVSPPTTEETLQGFRIVFSLSFDFAIRSGGKPRRKDRGEEQGGGK